MRGGGQLGAHLVVFHLSSIVHHLSSVVCCSSLLSVICHPLSIVCHPSFIIHCSPSIVHSPFAWSVVLHPLSVNFHLLSDILHPLSIVLHCCPLFIIHHPLSVILPLSSFVSCLSFIILCPLLVATSLLAKWHGGGWWWWWCSRGGYDDSGHWEQKALFVDNMWCGKHPQSSLDLPMSNSEGIPLPLLKGRGFCGVRNSLPWPLPSKPLPSYPWGFWNSCQH